MCRHSRSWVAIATNWPSWGERRPWGRRARGLRWDSDSDSEPSKQHGRLCGRVPRLARQVPMSSTCPFRNRFAMDKWTAVGTEQLEAVMATPTESEGYMTADRRTEQKVEQLDIRACASSSGRAPSRRTYDADLQMLPLRRQTRSNAVRKRKRQTRMQPRREVVVSEPPAMSSSQ